MPADISGRAISISVTALSITRSWSNSAEDCICLIAMQGDLKLNGMIGRLLQPLIRM